MNYQLTAFIMGSALAGLILWLVRRDHLHVRHALFWVVAAVAAALLGAFPKLSDALSAPLGISYGPLLPILLALGALLLKALSADIALTRLERDLRRLNQQLAIVEDAQIRLQEQAESSANK